MSNDTLGSVFRSFDEQPADPAPATETALVVSCSTSRCEHAARLWPVEPSWNVRPVSTLANRVSERYDGETVLDGTLAHLIGEFDVAAVIVVGHTRCTVLEDAYEYCVAPAESPAGMSARLRLLADGALEAEVVDESTPLRAARYRLVEYNVVRQVEFLREQLPDPITTVGYVYDQDGAYSSFPDAQYLVTLDGETGVSAPDDSVVRVANLL